MIKLGRSFTNAFRKARQVHPLVRKISEQEYDVRRSDGAFTRVVFLLNTGGLWAQCGCYAGNPAGRNAPLPCYHVAACLLLDSPAGNPPVSPAPTVAARPSPIAHSHCCPRCTALYPCYAPACAAIDDLHCDSCEQIEIQKCDFAISY